MSLLPGVLSGRPASARLLVAAEWLLVDGDPRATRARNGRLAALLFALGALYAQAVVPFVDRSLASMQLMVALGWCTALVLVVLPWQRMPGRVAVVSPLWALAILSVGVGGTWGALEDFDDLYGLVFAYTGLTMRPRHTLGVAAIALSGLAGAALLGHQHTGLVQLVSTIVISAAVGALIALAVATQRHNRDQLLLLHTSLERLAAAPDETAAARLTTALAAELLDADGVVLLLAEEPGSPVLAGRGGSGRGADFAAVRVDTVAEGSGISRAARTGKPVFVGADAAASPLLWSERVADRGAAAVLCIPIPGEGGTLGVLAVWWSRPRHALRASDQQVVELLSTQAGPVLTRLREVRWLDRAAATDALTGVANRRAFDRALARLPVEGAVVLFDLDQFKPVNDTHGHPAGDAVLRAFAQTLRGCIRDGDLAARIGGDEFAVLLPSAEQGGIAAVLDRLAQRWESLQGVTFSAGSARRAVDETPARVLARADAALYAAKRAQ